IVDGHQPCGRAVGLSDDRGSFDRGPDVRLRPAVPAWLAEPENTGIDQGLQTLLGQAKVSLTAGRMLADQRLQGLRPGEDGGDVYPVLTGTGLLGIGHRAGHVRAPPVAVSAAQGSPRGFRVRCAAGRCRRWRAGAPLRARTGRRSRPTCTVVSGCASRLWYQAGLFGCPLFDATSTRSEPLAR